MELDAVYKMIDELGIDPEKATDLKTEILKMYLSQYEKGAQLAIQLIKELPNDGPF